MAKYCGSIGYCTMTEAAPGVWEETITERRYYGDVVRNIRQVRGGENLNDELDISNSISIVSDPYAMENFHAIRYATFMGTKWKVTSVEVERPRLTLTLGGQYHDGNTD